MWESKIFIIVFIGDFNVLASTTVTNISKNRYIKVFNLQTNSLIHGVFTCG